MVLRVNLGPLHLFDNSVHEGLASNTDKSYVRKGSLVSQIVSKDLNKNFEIATFEMIHKINYIFLTLFGHQPL